MGELGRALPLTEADNTEGIAAKEAQAHRALQARSSQHRVGPALLADIHSYQNGGLSGKSEFQGPSLRQQETRKCHPPPSPAPVSGQAAVTRQQKLAGEDAVVARQPHPRPHLPLS